MTHYIERKQSSYQKTRRPEDSGMISLKCRKKNETKQKQTKQPMLQSKTEYLTTTKK